MDYNSIKEWLGQVPEMIEHRKTLNDQRMELLEWHKEKHMMIYELGNHDVPDPDKVAVKTSHISKPTEDSAVLMAGLNYIDKINAKTREIESINVKLNEIGDMLDAELAMGVITATEHRILFLTYFKCLSDKEIAKERDCAVNTVTKHKINAINALAGSLVL